MLSIFFQIVGYHGGYSPYACVHKFNTVIAVHIFAYPFYTFLIIENNLVCAYKMASQRNTGVYTDRCRLHGIQSEIDKVGFISGFFERVGYLDGKVIRIVAFKGKIPALGDGFVPFFFQSGRYAAL